MLVGADSTGGGVDIPQMMEGLQEVSFVILKESLFLGKESKKKKKNLIIAPFN